MLRPECRPTRAEGSPALPSRLLAVSLGIVMAACSADITRFDAPMFGLTGSGNRVSSVPIPQEGVWANGTSQLSESTPYDSGYRAPPRNRYAAAPQTASRPVAGYAPDRYRSDYQPAPSRPGYQTPPYRTAYEASPRQPDYRQHQTRTPQQTTEYRPQPQTRVAALPPQTAREPYRAPPAAHAAPARTIDRPVPPRTPPAAGSLEVEVQAGDTLYGLAERHGVSISELMTTNGLTSPVLRPGQRIMLPKGARVMAGAGRQDTDVNLGSARVAALRDPVPRAEPQASARVLPSRSDTTAAEEVPSADDPAETYTIRSGESLYSIAVRRGVSLAELQRINNIDDPRKVRAGTVLKLPPSASAVRTASDTPAASRTAVRAQPSGRSSPEIAAAPSAESSGEPPMEPVIINAPKRVASLGKPDTVTDAPPPLSPGRAPAADGRTAEEQADGLGKFRWPVRGRVIAGFGKQPDGSRSDGIKLAVPPGTEVHAAESGVVAFAGDELKDYGNLVLLRHDDGWITAYAHNDELTVKRGDRVRRGQVIAKAGTTGNAETPQLHFELRKGSSPVDPIPHLEKP